MKHKILYNFATRSRPAKAIACLDNITSMARHSDYEIIVTADFDDPSMFNDDIKDKVQSFPNTKILYGISTGKVNAINKNVGLAEQDWTILCNHSDDMHFIKEGFDLDIIEGFKGFNGLLHFSDGFVNERLCTYAIMSRDYYDSFGYIYFGGYMSVFCDNEQHEVAKILNAYKYADKRILEHRHFVHGFGQKDALLEITEDKVNYQTDGRLYQARKANNFYL